jgi:hypothetical protein
MAISYYVHFATYKIWLSSLFLLNCAEASLYNQLQNGLIIPSFYFCERSVERLLTWHFKRAKGGKVKWRSVQQGILCATWLMPNTIKINKVMHTWKHAHNWS